MVPQSDITGVTRPVSGSSGTSVATSGDAYRTTTLEDPWTAAKAVAAKPMGQRVMLSAKQIGVQKFQMSGVTVLKHSLMKSSSSNKSGDQLDVTAVDPKKRTFRPSAWLLNSIGLRLVREKVCVATFVVN